MSTSFHKIPEPSFPQYGAPGSRQRRPSILTDRPPGEYANADEPQRYELHESYRPTGSTVTSDNGQPHHMSSVSHSRIREENHRLEDDLELLRAERVATNASGPEGSRSRRNGSRSRVIEIEPVDEFDISTNPAHDNGKGVWRPPEKPANKFAQFLKMVSTYVYLIRIVIQTASMNCKLRITEGSWVVHHYSVLYIYHPASFNPLDTLAFGGICLRNSSRRRCPSDVVHGLARNGLAFFMGRKSSFAPVPNGKDF